MAPSSACRLARASLRTSSASGITQRVRMPPYSRDTFVQLAPQRPRVFATLTHPMKRGTQRSPARRSWLQCVSTCHLCQH
eukprot:988140-Amphidinium_carterae.1